MSLLVLKFGGTSVADIKSIERVADKVAKEVKLGHKLAVVVSAMSGVTNQLIEYCSEIDPSFDDKEHDAVVSSGEQVTAGLLAIALQKRGLKARSWLGWQIPFVTSNAHRKARIEDIESEEFKEDVLGGEIAVVAGFQGITNNRITTLGRGGSDTTAVALAASLNADRCDIYTDVDGVYTADPRIVHSAKKMDSISYEEMIELASIGAKVLQTRSVAMAMKRNVPVQVLSSFDDVLGSDLPGTLLVNEENVVEQEVVRGVTYSADEAKVVIRGVTDTPGIAAKIFTPLAEANINIDMIVQNISSDNKTDLTFTVVRDDLKKAVKVLEKASKSLGGIEIEASADVAKVSVVGIGMASHAGVAQKMFETLANKGINIQVINTSEIKISVLIPDDYTELAVRALHTAYGLDNEE